MNGVMTVVKSVDVRLYDTLVLRRPHRRDRIAPEWQRQDAVVIVWPHGHSDWRDCLDAIEKTYLELARHLSKYQRLILVAYDTAHVSHIRRRLDEASINVPINVANITFITIPTNDIWVRDYGPLCIAAGRILLDFVFDGWGGRYAHARDDAFTVGLIEQLRLNAEHHRIDQVLEGGNVEVNGRGELLCSSSCFRRKGVDINAAALEEKFAEWLGVTKTYWIDTTPLQGDDTDGHIDTLARFCGDDVIAYATPGHRNDSNGEALGRLVMQLRHLRNGGITLVPLPLPAPVFMSGRRLPASYTNFLITNRAVLIPTFNDKQDKYALETLEGLFPTREVIGIDGRVLARQCGGLHCATLQLPAGVLE